MVWGPRRAAGPRCVLGTRTPRRDTGLIEVRAISIDPALTSPEHDFDQPCGCQEGAHDVEQSVRGLRNHDTETSLLCNACLFGQF